MSNAKRVRGGNPASLLSAQAMGGIVAGEGFDFQVRYAACHLPLWLANGLHQLLFEGSGDIDVRFLAGNVSSRIHIQVKNNEVPVGEFKRVIQHFKELDSDFPAGTYERYTLACPALASKLRTIERGLARTRGASPFYDDIPGALSSTKEELDKRLNMCGLGEYTDFIHQKVFLDVGNGDLCHDDRATELFIARLLLHPEYKDKLRAMVQPAFAEITKAINSNKGNTLDRTAISDILNAAVLSTLAPERGITLWLQNWTQETFGPPADYTLDWSSHFDRTTRRVPSEAVWNGELVPQIEALKKKILLEKRDRLIRFRGKCALSTGIALGATFPVVGGWTIEVPQPPLREPWRSDAVPTEGYNLGIDTVDGQTNGQDIVLALNIRGDGRGDVVRYVEQTGTPPRLFVFMSPPSQGSLSISGPSDACAFSTAVREHLGKFLKLHQVKKSRIFFYGPLALAVLLGQQLTSVGEIQLFEYQDPSYVQSCTLRT